MGERTTEALRVHFDAHVRLEFQGATLTSDAGLLACRELDDVLGLTEAATRYLRESRSGRNVQHPLVSLLRQSVYSRLAGYEDTNDADRLAGDPAMRVVTGRRDLEKQAASTNTLSTYCLTNPRILLANLFPPSQANLSARHLHGRVPSKKP